MATRSSRARSQEIRQYIIDNVSSHPSDITNLTAEKFQISRQAAHRHVTNLVSDDILRSTGETKDRKYELKPILEQSFVLSLTDLLEEDVVWRERVRPYLGNLSANVLTICQYGFTEILNNAMDHSQGTEVFVSIEWHHTDIQLKIWDNGVGIFRKISEQLGLPNEYQAILELTKGKFTTDPKRHTGEGIFFTSRAFDRFWISSGKLLFAHDEPGDDWLLEDEEKTDGTAVTMGIHPNSRQTLKEVFDTYASSDEEYGFTRTRVPVSLARYGDENLISRSQAKRLLARFERFTEVTLDFANVETIGQAFADEIFRVFANEHPHVHLTWENANADVERMIRRAKANTPT